MHTIRWIQWPGRFGIILVLLLFLSSVVIARQGDDLSWWTVDGGGSVSSGGRFAVTGAIGQPDASLSLQGDRYTVQGGFWVEGRPVPVDDPNPTIFLPLIIKE